MGKALAAAASLLLLGAGAPAPEPRKSRVEAMLMTGLPLLWGEKGPFDPGARPSAAYADLTKEFDFRLVDVLDAETLARGRLLFLVQPKRLAPSELAALDNWIRNGGKALILTDPMLSWPSELPLGDIRRPPPVGLLAPLLSHWGLVLKPPEVPGEVESEWDGRRILLDSPGRFRDSNRDCITEPDGWTVMCRLGRGGVRLVGDADLMRDPLWTSRRAENSRIVAEWLDELAGVARERHRGSGKTGIAVPLALGLAALAGIGLLLRRRRRR